MNLKENCMDTPGQFPIIDGVAIPMDFERFVPPDLEQAVHFYPRYLGFGGKLKIQFYLCEIVRQLACYESAHGRAGSELKVCPWILG